MAQLKRTPLFSVCKESGGKMIDFGGWELPVQFSSIKEEHRAVREKVGLFDVSHMGEFEVKGEGSLLFLQKVMTNDMSKLKDGKALYTAMCYEDGGTVDDLLVYRKSKTDYLLVVNAANIEQDLQWLNEHREENVEITNVSNHMAQLALQGPLANEVLQSFTDTNLSTIKFFHFFENICLNGIDALVSRTGYTGEDGFEIYCAAEDAPALWKDLLQNEHVVPCGLGARDTLRFEANLALYGQELSKIISPIEAGIGFAVKVDKSIAFIGQEVLKKQKKEGPPRKLVGIEMVGKGIPRHGYSVWVDNHLAGEVTSGTQSPTLGKNVGLAILEKEFTDLGQELEVEIRKKRVKAVVVKTPFYKRT
ncbi:glycine cleavage system aminomethyltransferase GcvT [Bacillus carboniphilus]|uniref:Aminomethyltransferase n=1 Tax=Bacillus carboniphilus TaxID=86663 RepID=A0ABY9JZZ1_9BACI|nr:glycine cleavage system aminomethyltransferase GcvT [Bacillus carboniphilus]WLR43908.1 glycine cleavage system aminomethyltransferase GcvT [Bacillus carboniphilus]